MEDRELERRAIAGWHRFSSGEATDPPTIAKVVTVDALKYVVLENKHTTVAVYRVRNDGLLKKLKRMPYWVDRSAAHEPGSQVYVIGPQHMNRVKIGVTSDPIKQLSSMQIGSPHPLRIVHTHPGGAYLESRLHKRFSLFRTALGWFDFGAASAKILVRQAISEIEVA